MERSHPTWVSTSSRRSGVLVLERLADRREEREVQAMGRRRHVLEVREHPTRFEQTEDLAIQRALSLVLQMVDGHRRHDGVEAPQRGKRIAEVCLTSSMRSSWRSACLPPRA